MPQRKRPTRLTVRPSDSASTRAITLEISAAKPRNPVLQAAALGQVKLGSKKHEKSAGAKRQALKQALLKASGDSL